jgi:hypothetical protein
MKDKVKPSGVSCLADGERDRCAARRRSRPSRPRSRAAFFVVLRRALLQYRRLHSRARAEVAPEPALRVLRVRDVDLNRCVYDVEEARLHERIVAGESDG